MIQQTDIPTKPQGELDKDQLAMLDRPIPGASLTNSKDHKLPFENPPEITDLVKAKDLLWDRLSSEESLPQLFELLRQDVPVSSIAKTITFGGFAEGKWNQDLSLLLLEPAMIMIMFLAKQAGVPFVYDLNIPSLEGMMEDEKNKPYRDLMAGQPKEGLMVKKNGQ